MDLRLADQTDWNRAPVRAHPPARCETSDGAARSLGGPARHEPGSHASQAGQSRGMWVLLNSFLGITTTRPVLACTCVVTGDQVDWYLLLRNMATYEDKRRQKSTLTHSSVSTLADGSPSRVRVPRSRAEDCHIEKNGCRRRATARASLVRLSLIHI